MMGLGVSSAFGPQVPNMYTLRMVKPSQPLTPGVTSHGVGMEALAVWGQRGGKYTNLYLIRIKAWV